MPNKLVLNLPIRSICLLKAVTVLTCASQHITSTLKTKQEQSVQDWGVGCTRDQTPTDQAFVLQQGRTWLM